MAIPLTRRELLRAAGASALLAPTGCSILWPDRGSGKDLIPRLEPPYNAEPRLDRLVESWITPFRYFFVRTHGTIPSIDVATYALTVEGHVERSLRLTIEDLERLPRVAVTATLQCAENRRSEVHRLKPLEGIPWDAGAIGTAEWKGVRVADLLARAGVREGARYVWFDGIDTVTLPDRQTVFGAQVPLDRAQRPETIVAMEMNGAPLSRDHGYPARVVVPGSIGARSVKWLGRIVVAEKKSENHFVARGFKRIPPDADPAKLKLETLEPVADASLNSAIGRPLAGQTVKAGRLQVRGYAIPPGVPGVTVAGVEVSPDGGASWVAATLLGKDVPFAWKLWTVDVQVAPGARTLIARAVDSAGGKQPELPAWTPNGLFYDGWHRVPITVA